MSLDRRWFSLLGVSFVALLAVTASSFSGPDDRPCCGLVDQSGPQLTITLDRLHVEDHWPAHEHVNWETGDPERGRAYEGLGHTHCTAFAAAAAKRLGIDLLRPPEHGQKLLANAQVSWLAGAEGRAHGWCPVPDGREAYRLANQGNLVVAVFANPDAQKAGHVAIVRPSEKPMVALVRDRPQVIQAGTHNHNCFALRIGFANHPGAFPDGVRYYVQPMQGLF